MALKIETEWRVRTLERYCCEHYIVTINTTDQRKPLFIPLVIFKKYFGLANRIQEEKNLTKHFVIFLNTFDITWVLLVSIWPAICSTHRTILVQALSSFWAIHNTWSSTNIILLAISIRASPIWKREKKTKKKVLSVKLTK